MIKLIIMLIGVASLMFFKGDMNVSLPAIVILGVVSLLMTQKLFFELLRIEQDIAKKEAFSSTKKELKEGTIATIVGLILVILLDSYKVVNFWLMYVWISSVGLVLLAFVESSLAYFSLIPFIVDEDKED